MLPSLRAPDDRIANSFPIFLGLLWDHLRLPSPTPAQYEIARFLQEGWTLYGEPVEMIGRADLIIGFRGIGKSWITSGFVAWKLYRNPQDEKVLVISASSKRAKKFVSQLKQIIASMPLLYDLVPRPDQRDSVDLFDVNGASLAQSPSVQASGITGQVTGDRATTIINDDIEIRENSKTEEARADLLERCNEFDNIKVPPNFAPDGKTIVSPGGDVFYLGTPQSEESIYHRRVKDFGYRAWTWPARYPGLDVLDHYEIETADRGTINILAPPLLERLKASEGALKGQPTDTRFPQEVLLERESHGRMNWLLQYMLDTSLSDEERYPLKLRDAMVMPVNPTMAPRVVQYGYDKDKKNRRLDLANTYGFTGDYWIAPLFQSGLDDWAPYDQSVLYVDPSGKGADETAWCVVKSLNGMYYCMGIWGMNTHAARKAAEGRGWTAEDGDVYDIRMEEIAKCAKEFNVNEIVIEENYGNGLWTKSFQPILAKLWPSKHKDEASGCSCVEQTVTGQKELRVIDALEPILLNHRLVLDEKMAKDEEFCYQYTHITRDHNALQHDDRIEVLAEAVKWLADAASIDIHEAADAQREEKKFKTVEYFIESMTHPEYKHGRPGMAGGGMKAKYKGDDDWFDEPPEVYQEKFNFRG